MLDDAGLFLTIAEIAGVFVGFAALIGVTRRSDAAGPQRARVQAVVTSGLLVVVAAIVPVGLAAYGLGDRGVWVVSSLVYLALNWAVIALALRRSTNRDLARAQWRETPAGAAFFWVLEAAIQVPLLLVVLGVARDVDPALYLTALAFHLFEAAFILAQLVYGEAGR